MRRRVATGILAIAVSAGTTAASAALAVTVEGGPVVIAAAATAPAGLPSSKQVPAVLGLAFNSELPGSELPPELERIEIGISGDVSLRTAGLPSCPIARLSSEYGDARQTCAGSIVGHGTVDSEVVLPGRAAVPLHGQLVAFYSYAEHHPRVLAQVTGEGELPLTYVIPFEIRRGEGAFGTDLLVRQMHLVRGRCPSHHPGCFAEPYALKGVYGRISAFQMSLGRRFVRAGCAVRADAAEPLLARFELRYTEGSEVAVTVDDAC